MYVDPRGPRFAAVITTVVLALVLVTANEWIMLAQTLVFGAGAAFGLSRAPYGVLFRRLVRPRLAPPHDLEPEAPPRFAQAVGFAFGLVASIALFAGATTLGLVAAGCAFAAAFLNAAFGYCLGCEIYLLSIRAFGPRRSPDRVASGPVSGSTVPDRPATTKEFST
jgi:hypothetical protein